RNWNFDSVTTNFFVRNAVFPNSSQTGDFIISVNGNPLINGGCTFNELIINVFDPLSMKPWRNIYSGGSGLYNSLSSTCGPSREFNFEYPLNTISGRKNAMDFLDIIPPNAFVVIRSNTNSSSSANTY